MTDEIIENDDGSNEFIFIAFHHTLRVMKCAKNKIHYI